MAEESNTAIDAGNDAGDVSTSMGDSDVELQSQSESGAVQVDVPSDASATDAKGDGSPGGDDNSAKQEAVTTAPTVDAKVLERAKNVGIPENMLGFIKDENQLDLLLGMQAVLNQQRSTAQQGQQPVVESDPAKPQTPAQQQALADALNLELSEELDEVFTGPLKQVADFANSKIGQLSSGQQAIAGVVSQLHQVVQTMQQQAMEHRIERFDEYITSLGDDYKDVFGQGPSDSLDPSSPQYAARVRLLQSSEMLALGRAQSGGSRMKDRDQWSRALNMEFADTVKGKAVAAERTKMAAQIDKNGRRAINRPNGVRSSSKELPPGIEKAMAGLKEKFPDKFADEKD